jgi:hypothetical protein
MKLRPDWYTFYPKKRRYGLTWQIHQNESKFTEKQLCQIVALTLMSLDFYLPKKYRVVFLFKVSEGMRGNHTGWVEKSGSRIVRRFSTIIVSVDQFDEGDLRSLAGIVHILAHELEHARQRYKRIRNSKPGTHGDHHEHAADVASNIALINIIGSPGLLAGAKDIVRKSRRKEKP